MKNYLKTLTILVIFNTSHYSVYAWGFFGHKKINEIAVYTLPPEMFGFYKLHSCFLIEHAVDADKRRYAVKEEACRHFLDGDFYEKALPLDTIPRKWKAAIAKYGMDTITTHGIVPWHVQVMFYRLTEAFRKRDYYKILRYSADLGHYVGDCHVPLHATGNYNGQKTGQHGIHGLWESRLPELYFDNYDLLSGQAVYIEDPLESAWLAFEGSFALVDSVLRAEKELSRLFPEDRKFAFEPRGNLTIKVYSESFSKAYQSKMGTMVESRMRSAIALLGNLWYTAWVNAGQPDLDKINKDTAPIEDVPEEIPAPVAAPALLLIRPEDD
ncbi:MAG: S1/P1 Nuclease [Bacteroidia bacterium]|nr:S1/P1 Nuclease [Bacteroidia bacterium]